MPDQFETLKQKYQPVLDKIQEEGAQLMNVNMDGNQLFIKAIAVSEISKDRIWNAIKAVDPTYADLKHDIEAKTGPQDYTVQPGDNLSKISKHFYGDANKYWSSPKPIISPIPTKSRSARSWSFQPRRKSGLRPSGLRHYGVRLVKIC